MSSYSRLTRVIFKYYLQLMSVYIECMFKLYKAHTCEDSMLQHARARVTYGCQK